MKKKIDKVFQQFPSIFRFIPESKIFKKTVKSRVLFLITTFLLIVFNLTMIIAIGFLSLNTYKNFNKYKELSATRNKLLSEVNFWKSVTLQYDGYKDGYFKVAILEYRLGNLSQANIYNNNALLLDPNYRDAKMLKEIIEKSL